MGKFTQTVPSDCARHFHAPLVCSRSEDLPKEQTDVGTADAKRVQRLMELDVVGQ